MAKTIQYIKTNQVRKKLGTRLQLSVYGEATGKRV